MRPVVMGSPLVAGFRCLCERRYERRMETLFVWMIVEGCDAVS